MITIGIGNRKGGVGSTTLTFHLAALLQRAGMTVTIVETASTLTNLHWCSGRADKARQDMNCSKKAISYLHLDDCPGRLKNYELGSEFCLVDYSNGVDIKTVMSHVQHWICPFGPLDVRPTLQTYEHWQDLHPDAYAQRQTFSAVLSLMPGLDDIAREPRYADSRWNGDQAIDALSTEAPRMHVLQQRLTRADATADTFGGRDVFSDLDPEAVASCTEIESVWGEILAFMKQGGVPPTPSAPAGSGGQPRFFPGGNGTSSAMARPW